MRVPGVRAVLASVWAVVWFVVVVVVSRDEGGLVRGGECQ